MSAPFDRSRRTKLTRRDLGRFGGDTLFDRVARVLCDAECVPRKELFESWEVARRARRRFRGGRVVDLACGHGLVAHLMLLIDDSSPSAIAADVRLPPSARPASDALASAWPRLAGRVTFVEAPLKHVELGPGDVVVSAHACGGLTDDVLERAIAARARVAVLPCCQALGRSDHGGLDGWLDGALAIDVMRAERLRSHGYRVHTQRIAPGITEKDRLLLGDPGASRQLLP
jgi:hypothetical protein